MYTVHNDWCLFFFLLLRLFFFLQHTSNSAFLWGLGQPSLSAFHDWFVEYSRNLFLFATLIRILGAMSCWSFLATGSVWPLVTAEVVVKLIGDVVVVVVVGWVAGSTSLETGPDLQMTPAASVSWQSFWDQPSNRHSVRFFSLPVQYMLSIQKESIEIRSMKSWRTY